MANLGRGNHAGSSRRRGGSPSPKIAAASRQRFVGPAARGGLAFVAALLTSRCAYQPFATGTRTPGRINDVKTRSVGAKSPETIATYLLKPFSHAVMHRCGTTA